MCYVGYPVRQPGPGALTAANGALALILGPVRAAALRALRQFDQAFSAGSRLNQHEAVAVVRDRHGGPSRKSPSPNVNRGQRQLDAIRVVGSQTVASVLQETPAAGRLCYLNLDEVSAPGHRLVASSWVISG